jgi:hypothetical protein
MSWQVTRWGGEGRESQWRERLQRFAKSRQSVVAFCAAESVSVPSFYYWRTKLSAGGAPRRAAAPMDAPGFIDVGGLLGAHGPDRGATTSDALATGIELRIELGGGVVLQVTRR